MCVAQERARKREKKKERWGEKRNHSRREEEDEETSCAGRGGLSLLCLSSIKIEKKKMGFLVSLTTFLVRWK